VRREALLFRVGVRDRHLRPVAAGRWSWGQPDLGGAGEGGKQPWQSRGVPVLPDGAGPASEAKRSTWGTGVITPFKLVTGSNLADVGRVRCFPAGQAGGRDLLGWFYLLVWEAMGKVCGVPVAMPLGQSRAPPSASGQQW